jgi:hypothetical protein
MENNHKKYYKGAVALGVVLIATFFIYRGTIIAKTVSQNENKTLKEQGLNEYIDPSKNPKYNQVYNEITFIGDGINKEELENINTIVNLKDNTGEEPKAIIGEEIIPISQVKIGQKIRSISYNSGLEDNKITEINYYRGKNEGLDNEREKRKQLKEGKEKNTEIQKAITKLDEDIAKQEQKIQKNKENWDKKIKNKKSQIDAIKTKTQTAVSTSNKELMDMLYPSQESIDKLNNEILEERRKIKELGLDKLWKQEELRQKVVSNFLPQVQAEYLNNFIADLVVYSRSNIGLRIDLKGNGVYNGNGFHLWQANGGNAQKFKFIDESGEIKYAGNTGFCLDVDLANGNYDNGDKVHLWQCHGGVNQKWVAFPSGEIKPLNNQNYCLDASTGVSQGSTLHLWRCHGGDNQKFQIGEEDFGKFDYYIRLHASTSQYTGTNLTGHAFVSLPKREKANSYWRITNSFGFWNNRDSNNTNDMARTNNIHARFNGNGLFAYLHTDNHSDWLNGQLNVDYLGGEFGGYRRTTSGIPKQRFEEIKYMRGYNVSNYRDKNYNLCNANCAAYSVALYNQYNRGVSWGDSYNDPDYNPWSGGILGGNCAYPGNIYKVL